MIDRIAGGGPDGLVTLAVMSDTHGDQTVYSRFMETGDKPPDALIHLGDMGTTAWVEAAASILPILSVAGNSDFSRAAAPACRVFQAGDLRFACVHGHLQQVKQGLGALVRLADACEADVVLFGHTHRYFSDIAVSPSGRRILLLNPGSAHGFGAQTGAGFVRLTLQGRRISVQRIVASVIFHRDFDLS